MLLSQQASPFNNGEQGVRAINGKRLSRRRRRIARKMRARLAVDLQSGRLSLRALTAQQACAVADVTPAELAAEKRRAKNGGKGHGHTRLFYRKSPTDSDLDVAVASFGSRLMAALDRAMRPRCQQTGEMFKPVAR